jgi:hypothetical protein
MSLRNGACRILLTGVFLVLSMSALFAQMAPQQSTTDSSDAFVGTWQAQFKGKSFVTIKLAKQEGKLTGTVSHSDVDLDKNGELTRAEQRDGDDPIVDARVTGKMLRLTTKDEESQDTDQLEMKLTGPDQAELRFVGTPSDVPAPKPWKMERTHTKP